MATTRDPREFTMSFGDHLDELRKRLIWAFVGPLPIFIVCLVFGGPLLEFLVQPASDQLREAGLPARMLATSPTEPFTAYLKVATAVAIVAAGPWILYQIWLFIAPGLYTHERRFAYFLFPLSALLTVTGAVFLYTVLLPVSLRFLILFGSMLVSNPTTTAPLPPDVEPGSIAILQADPIDPAPGSWWINESLNELRFAMPGKGGAAGAAVRGVPLSGGGMIAQEYRIGEYVNLIFALAIVFAIAFQLPVALLLANWLGLVQEDWLKKQRRYALFIIAILSAIVTPADPMSMLFLMLPLAALFELSLILMRLVPASRVAGRTDQKEPPDAGDA
jgi:sec-independent protein translocase protein TatC